jgi:hypothetical protein
MGTYIPLDTLDTDLNDDGRPDKASLTPYVHKFDIDFDGVVGANDVDYVNSQMNQALDLNVIKTGLFTGVNASLTWPDGWTCQVRAVVPANIKKFVGTKMSYGWLHGTRYPYSATTGFYECYQFSGDLSIATYKALGYGIIFPAMSGAEDSHAYNVFFLGGDWKRVENWRLIEPQDGSQYAPAIGKTTPKYNTDTIYFYGSLGSVGQIITHTLHIDASGMVSYGNNATMSYSGLLESTPDYFDPFLGMEGDDTMTLDAKARTFARLHPTHDGGTWHLWCAALMARMCIAYGTVPSFPFPATAKIAGDLAGTLNPDYTKAPIGAFHYWTAGSDGHVGLDTKGGGSNIFMASAFIAESLGNAIGFQSVDTYTRNGSYPYRGWSMSYGKNGKITQEVPVTIPVVVPAPIVTSTPVVSTPVLSVAMKWCIDQGIFDKGTSPTKALDANFLAWSLYRAKGKI